MKDMKTLIISVLASVITGTGTWIYTSSNRLAVVEAKVVNIEKGQDRIENKIDKLIFSLATENKSED